MLKADLVNWSVTARERFIYSTVG